MGQMRVVGGHRSANLVRAGEVVAEAAARGAEVVVLPEALDLGWTHPSARTGAEPIPGGAACRELCRLASDHGVHLCAGLVERDGERLFNAAILVGPEGRILLHHRKIHELEFARELYATGDRLGVADTALGRIGVMICADAFVEGLVIARTLGHLGAEIILSPCAWAVPADHDNEAEPYGGLWRDSFGPVAREFGLRIVGVSNVGTLDAGAWAGRRCIGCSMVVGPDGRVAVEAPYGEEADTIVLAGIPRRSV